MKPLGRQARANADVRWTRLYGSRLFEGSETTAVCISPWDAERKRTTQGREGLTLAHSTWAEAQLSAVSLLPPRPVSALRADLAQEAEGAAESTSRTMGCKLRSGDFN